MGRTPAQHETNRGWQPKVWTEGGTQRQRKIKKPQKKGGMIKVKVMERVKVNMVSLG